jgi:hypothetical protein
MLKFKKELFAMCNQFDKKEGREAPSSSNKGKK